MLHVGKHAARLDGDGVIQAVDAANAVHAPEREHDLAALARRHRAARQAGVAALGHNRDLVLGGERDHARHLRGARRTHHGFRGPRVLAPPICKVRPGIVRIGQDIGGAYNVAKLRFELH